MHPPPAGNRPRNAAASGLEKAADGYAAHVSVLKTLHVLGAIFLLGGVTTHVLLRPTATRAVDVSQHALYQFAWRVELLMVYVGLALCLLPGSFFWFGNFKLFQG